MGAITEMATSAPGNNSIRPKDKAPLAEILKLNGYSTAQFGKCHEVPFWEVTPVGPFHQWPTGSGFEYFYGFVGGEANQYYPGLYEGTDRGRAAEDARGGLHADRGPGRPGHHLGPPAEGADAGQALLHVLRARRDACAAPRARRNGRTSTRASSTAGWDKLREETLARQKKLGVIPQDAVLTDAAQGDPRAGTRCRPT